MIALHRNVQHAVARPSFARFVVRIEDWLERRRQRRALLALDDKLLKDIGLAPSDAWREAHKPFWRV
ncbi:MAG: DUF1127 domain-containing protein [Geminicoccaceae bacterium]